MKFFIFNFEIVLQSENNGLGYFFPLIFYRTVNFIEHKLSETAGNPVGLSSLFKIIKKKREQDKIVIIKNGKGGLRVVKMTSNIKSQAQLHAKMIVSPNHFRLFNIVN